MLLDEAEMRGALSGPFETGGQHTGLCSARPRKLPLLFAARTRSQKRQAANTPTRASALAEASLYTDLPKNDINTANKPGALPGRS